MNTQNEAGTFTIEHYQRLFTAPVYFTILRNTFEIAGWTTLLCIVGGYPIENLQTALGATPDPREIDIILLIAPEGG